MSKIKPFFTYSGNSTYCYLLKDRESLEVVSGGAYCRPPDQFCKATGRRIALTKALKASNLTKEERREVWTEYFEHHADLSRSKQRRLARALRDERLLQQRLDDLARPK